MSRNIAADGQHNGERMKKGKIRETLTRLREELQHAEGIDADSRRKMEELHRDLEQLNDADDPDVDSLLDRARELETRFAADHPTLERIVRDLADTIAKMGI
jgi:ABC-type transporter Mla subunit MlaD